MREVTFSEFQEVAKRRGHTPESLGHFFRGKIDGPREFFECVMTRLYHGEDVSDTVIPYRSVVEFYNSEQHYLCDSNPKQRRCACGCEVAVFGRRKWSTAGCRKRMQREKALD